MPERERGGLMARGGECTRRCRSRQHADLVSAAITQATDEPLISYLCWVCHNAATGTDSAGRTPLHVAASCGRSKLVEWLVQVRGVPLNTEDRESGMTALQRAVFYGQLSCVRTLMKLGASAVTRDHADMTAYDGVHADRLPPSDLHLNLPCEAYVWGTNLWYSIGVERIKERPTPEPLDVFRRAGVWIKQIAMSKFHTVFLTHSGSVYTCGHGIGGRLGHGDEESALAPKELRGLKGETCVQVAVSVDHTVLLMESGTVWTCGQNGWYQLGHAPPPRQLNTPRLVDWSRARQPRITGVCAARYHTVFWNSESLYCVGLNGGQLGQHKDETSDKRILTPRKVTMLSRDGGSGSLELTHVACSDGATAFATASGDVLLMHQYRCRRVASRMLNLRQLRVHGGALEDTQDVGRQERAAPLQLLVLSAEGGLYIWHQDRPIITRCEIGLRQQLSVSDMELDKHGLIFISERGQAYTGTVTLPSLSDKPLKQAKDGRRLGSAALMAPRAHVRVTRVPHVHRAVRVTCDGNGGNAAVVQCDPRAALLELPEVSASTLRSDLHALLDSADVTDSIHDCILQAGQTRFASHRYILASASPSLAQQLSFCSPDATLKLDVPPAVLRQVLLYAYTGTCDLLRPGHTEFCLEAHCTARKDRPKPQKQKPVQPVQVVRDAARKLGLHALHRRLEGVRLVGGRVEVPRGFDDAPSVLYLDRCSPTAAALADVPLTSEDGTLFMCHKCVLAARLEYFNMMFNSCFWAESAAGETVRLSMSAAVLQLVLQFCYTGSVLLQPDHRDQLDTDDVELLCALLAATDHLMANRLKQICEVALSRQLTLKNAVDLLEFSSLYSADQLKTTCMEFICLNLAAVMENRSLESASDAVVDDLSAHYRRVNTTLRRYRPAPVMSGPPSAQLIHQVHASYPVSWDEPLPALSAAEEVRSRPPPRRRAARVASGGSEGDARRASGGTEGDARSRAASTSSLTSQASEEAELDLSELTERETTSSAPAEFTLVTRRRHQDRTERQTCLPEQPETTPERYIPGITPKPRPVRAPQPITEPPDDDPVTPDQAAATPAVTSPLEAFPSLGEAFPARNGTGVLSGVAVTSQSPHCSERQRDARRSKKGRRGRALDLTADQPATPVTSRPQAPVTSPELARQLSSGSDRPAWGGTAPGAGGVSSLADIMAEEAAEAEVHTPAPATAPVAVPCQRRLPPSPCSTAESLSSPPPAWRTPQSPTNGETAPPEVTSLNDIIQQERRKIKTRAQISNKSLALIQIEERAIAELLEHYEAAETTTERITVERDHTEAAEPQWSRRPR